MTKRASNVISLRKRKIQKKYVKVFKKNKFLFIFIAIPILIASFIIIDKWIIKYKFASQNIENISYYETCKDYV